MSTGYQKSKQWFEDNDQYFLSKALPNEIEYNKLSLIRVYPSTGKTQPGWGAAEFMKNYQDNAFDPQRALRHFEKYGSPFGIVMLGVSTALCMAVRASCSASRMRCPCW